MQFAVRSWRDLPPLDSLMHDESLRQITLMTAVHTRLGRSLSSRARIVADGRWTGWSAQLMPPRSGINISYGFSNTYSPPSRNITITSCLPPFILTVHASQ